MLSTASLQRLIVTVILLILAILLSSCGGHHLAGADRHPYEVAPIAGSEFGSSAPEYDDAW